MTSLKGMNGKTQPRTTNLIKPTKQNIKGRQTVGFFLSLFQSKIERLPWKIQLTAERLLQTFYPVCRLYYIHYIGFTSNLILNCTNKRLFVKAY